MAAKEKYRLLLNLGLLGFGSLASTFDIAYAKKSSYVNFNKAANYDFTVGYLADSSKKLFQDKSKVENKDNVFLTFKVLADKQYDYDQNIFLAEGNVKTLINGGILKCDFLSYEKSTGILIANGNISFYKGGQYFRGNQFKYNLIKKEGTITDTYGILDIDNVLDDLKIEPYSEKIIFRSKTLDQLRNKEEIIYNDGIEFSFGNIKIPQNKITRANKSIGSINNWRFKSDLITIQEEGWKSNKIIFTNDPLDPHQISFEGINVIAEEKEEKLLITSSKTNLILGRRTKIFLGKRIFGDKKKNKNKLEFMIDNKDRDGLVIFRRSNNTKINSNINFNSQPQFLISRAILGRTSSYKSYQSKKSKDVSFTDLFGINTKLNADYKDWSFDSLIDLSTLNINRFKEGIRHSSSLKRNLTIPIIDKSILNIFTTYRSRAWNGTIGETEIKSAFGGFIENKKNFRIGELRNNFTFRIGTAKYEAEKLSNSEIISLWRSSLFSSLNSEYEIWKTKVETLSKKKDMPLSPISVKPELVFRTNINSAFFKYEDGHEQGFIKLSLGPEIRVGELKRNFFDYTKLSIMPGIKIKAGNSPFKFDNAIDLKTLNLGFMQQIYGPIILDISSNINIGNASENYGDYYDTKIGLLCHRRAYEFGIYYHPNNDAGGIYFRLNGFKFSNSVKPVF